MHRRIRLEDDYASGGAGCPSRVDGCEADVRAAFDDDPTGWNVGSEELDKGRSRPCSASSRT